MVSSGFGEEERYLEKLVLDSDFANNLLVYGGANSNVFVRVVYFTKKLYCVANVKPCDSCRHCKLISSFAHPNVKLILPIVNENVSDNGIIDSFLKFFSNSSSINLFSWGATLKSQNKKLIIPKDSISTIIDFTESRYLDDLPRICVIWGPEFLNINSANFLLKTLEEPPKKCLFMLISEDIGSVLETIKSRTITVFFNDIYEGQSDEESVKVFLDILRKAYVFNYLEVYKFIDDFVKLGRKYILDVLKSGFNLLNYLIECEFKNIDISDELRNSLFGLYKIISLNEVKSVFSYVNECIVNIEFNANLRITMFKFISKINQIFKKR